MPHVNTAAEASAVVDAAKFHPVGTRGSYTSRQGIGVDDYSIKANDETVLIVLIEDIVAVRNQAEILEVDHIDVFFVAPGDLAQSIGRPGNSSQADVVKAAADAIAKITDAGRVAERPAPPRRSRGKSTRASVFVTTLFDNWLRDGARDFLSRV